MRQRVNITPEELRQRYADAGQTIVVIAASLGCSPATISNRLRSYGIPTRPSRFFKRINIPREVILQLYWVERVEVREIAERLDVSTGTINNLRKGYDIPARPRARAAALSDAADATSARPAKAGLKPPGGRQIGERRQLYWAYLPHPPSGARCSDHSGGGRKPLAEDLEKLFALSSPLALIRLLIVRHE